MDSALQYFSLRLIFQAVLLHQEQAIFSLSCQLLQHDLCCHKLDLNHVQTFPYV